MKTTTWSIPDEAGSGSAANEDVMSGESGPVGRQPSAIAPAALAALVRKVRRSMIPRGYPWRPGGVRSQRPLSFYRLAVLSKTVVLTGRAGRAPGSAGVNPRLAPRRLQK